MTTLSYDFRITGMQHVRAALRGVEKDIQRFNRRVTGGASTRRAGGQAGAAQLQRMQHRETLQKQRHIQRIAEMERREALKTHGHRERLIQKEATMRMRQEARVARKTKTLQQRFARGSVGAVKGGLRRVGSMGTVALGLTGMAGGMLMSSAISAEKTKQAQAAELANQAFGTGPAKGQSRNQLQKRILSTGRAVGSVSGLGADRVIGAMRQFHGKAGDINAATELAPFMADIADASGAELSDVGEFAGQTFMSAMAQGMDPAKAKQAVKDIMVVAAGQAKSGAIELRDMASQGGKLLSAAGRFGGDFGSLANTMGAVGQMAIAGGASSPDEAMTALMRLADDLGKKGGTASFRKHGIDVFTDKSKTALRDPAELIMESVMKTGGAIPELADMFGIRGMKAVEPFRKMFVEAGRGEKGAKAMRDAFERGTSQTMSLEEVGGSAANRRAQADRQFDKAMENFNDAVGQELLPALTELIPHITRLTPHMAELAKATGEALDWAAENPGKAITGAIVASIGASALGSAVSAAITAIITRAAGAAAGGAAGAAGAMGGAGKAGLAGVAGAAVFAAGYNAYQLHQEVDGGILNTYDALDAENETTRARRAEYLRLAEAQGMSQVKIKEGSAFADFTGGSDKFLRRGEGGKVVASDVAHAEGGGIDAVVAKLKGVQGGTDAFKSAMGEAAEAARKFAANAGSGLNRGDAPGTPSPTSAR